MSTSASKQFDGPTLEEALAAAVDELGEDLEIIDAQRLHRRGLLGLKRRQRFEVTASARPAVEPRGFEEVLRQMVDRVDRAERAVAPALDPDEEPADGDPDWWRDAELIVPEAPTPGAGAGLDLELDVRLEPARATARSTLDPPPVHTPRRARPMPVDSAVTPTLLAEPQAPTWSTEALLDLDLPPALVGRLRPDELQADLDWVAALATAIGELLETAESLSGPCELTGHGAEAAVHLIRGACDGFRLDSLIIDGRRVPATPLELALAVRSLLGISP